MFYAAFRRARSAAIVYLGIVAAIAIGAVVIVFISNGGQFKVIPVNSSTTTMHTVDGVTTVTVTDGNKTVGAHGQAGHGRSHGHLHGSLQYDQDVYALIVLGMTYGLAFLATAMGLTYAAENDGHLEFAWTRPVTRERYALGILGVDLAVMLAAFAISIAIAMLGVIGCGGISVFAQSHVALGDFGPALLGLGFPFLIYAWIAALSASLRRGRAFAVLLWPAMFVLALAASQTSSGSPFKPVLVALSRFVNPLEIFSQDTGHDLATGWAAYGIAFALALIALTVAQGRRLEA
jgi:hypothetical protein